MASTKAKYALDGTAEYWVDGKAATKAEYEAASPSKLASFAQAHPEELRKSTGWPMNSVSLGCHPDQVVEMTRFYAEQGIDARFDSKTGRLRCEDQKDYNRKAEAVEHWHGDYGPSRALEEKLKWRKTQRSQR